MTQDDRNRLTLAVKALHRGDRVRARQLVHQALTEDPRNVRAWTWACELAATWEERVYCLERILEVDPAHEPARRYLARLEGQAAEGGALTSMAPPSSPADNLPPKGRARQGVLNLLLSPFSWLLGTSPTTLLLVVVALAVVGGIVYFRANTTFFGLAKLDFDTLTISDSYEEIAADGGYWQVTFEGQGTSEFAGVVRHVSPFRDDRVCILTHDVLVTSGDFADPDIVSTSVFNHHFRWQSLGVQKPAGAINLLHTVPANEEVYRQLLEIRTWEQVVVAGREILTIKAYDGDGDFIGSWQDTGCNTLLVESVRWVEE